MKQKILLLSALALSSLALAQGGVGINTDTPKATLDVAIGTSYANGDLAGIAAPQLTGDQIEAMAITDLKAGTLVYATTASTAATKDVNSIGFWYWKDATAKWEPFTSGSSTGAKWVDGATAGDIELVNPTGKDNVKYTDAGYKAIDKENVDIQSYNVVTQAYDAANPSNLNVFNHTRSLSNYVVTNNAADTNRSTHLYQTVFDETDSTPAGSNVFNFQAQAITDKDFTSTNVAGVTGGVLSARHNGTGKITFQVRGLYSEAVLFPDAETAVVRGAQSLGVTYSTKNLNEVSGIINQAVYRGSGSIIRLAGLDNQVISTKINAASPAITSPISELYGIRNTVLTGADTTGAIANYFGIRITSTINAATPVTNAYGIKIENMPTHPTGNNFSLYTGTGKVFLGDFTGLNTTTPLSRLSVNGNAAIGTYAGTIAAPSNGLIVSGSVGIGSDTPIAKLHVKGGHIAIQGNANDTSNAAVTMFYNSAGTRMGYVGDGSSLNDDTYLYSDVADIRLAAGSLNAANSIFVKNTTGNLGVGVSSPAEKLEVAGAIVIGDAATAGTCTKAGQIYWNGTNFMGCTTASGAGVPLN